MRIFVLPVVAWGLLGWAAVGQAIEVHPTQTQIEAALERGRAAATARTPPDRLYAWFGPRRELEPQGFLMSKIVGLTVMSAHFALRSATPSEREIKQVLDDELLLVSVVIFGDWPDFAVDSYMTLTQGERVIKPVRVRFDGQAARTSVWPNQPAYRAKVVASFRYADLDPKARTRLSVFPPRGGEVSFDLDFGTIE
ncbi:MAG: hypothetical protein AB1411_14555 [Nitrospirota bacterium]